jgi:uncharacterized protein (TIGR00288 family)
MNAENLCVLIDFENVAAGTERENLGKFNIKLVMNHLKDKGRILLSRAYGDWGRFAKFKQSMLEQGISMMELTSYRGQDKNRADIALVVDAMELVYARPHIQTFVLMSGDSDFTPLVMKLRELNKRIIGLGTRKATSRLLAEACDEFIFYDSLLRRSKGDEEFTDESATPRSFSTQEGFALLVKTISTIQRDEPKPTAAGMVKQFILRKYPTFDETDLGHNGFTEFLEAAAKRNLVHLRNNDRGGGYLVTLINPSEETEPVQVLEFEHQITKDWNGILQQQGINTTNHLLRHTIVHEFVDHVLERRVQQKRSTLLFTNGDIARRCRKTSPKASISEVEHILLALKNAGELFGHDNTPIRSKRAHFTIHKDAEDLLASLRLYYLTELLKHITLDAVIENPEALSELLWNDLQHTDGMASAIEELKSNVSSEPSDSKTETNNTSTEQNADDVPAEPAAVEPPKPATKKKPAARKPRQTKAKTPKKSDTTEDEKVEPKSTSTRTKKSTDKKTVKTPPKSEPPVNED